MSSRTPITDGQLILKLGRENCELFECLKQLTDACAESGWPLIAEHMVPMNEARALLARLDKEEE